MRNKIYRCYLSTATINVETYFVGDIDIGSSNWSERTTYTRQVNNLPLVCRQVYQESQPFHNNYHTLKVIIAKGFDWLMKEVRYFSAHRNLGTVRKVEFMENTALDIVWCYEQFLAAAGDGFDWTSTSWWSRLNRTFSQSRLLPALEVVVWPGTASQVPLEKREAAVRLVLNNLDIQVVSGLT